METKNDLVSVVIPVFNSEKFVIESIESVLNQTYQNIEIFVIDDGSTDNSNEILNQFSDKITLITQKNQGLSSSLQHGIRKIRGKWFKWLSPDDALKSEAIETLVKNAKKLPPNTILYSNWEIMDENGNKLRDFSETNYNELSNFDFNVRLLDGQQINVNTSLIPSHLFEKGCNIQDLEDPVAIDYDFFLRAGLVYKTKFHLIPKSLVKYRINSNQLSKKNITKTLDYLNFVRQTILSELETSEMEKYLSSLKKYQNKKPIIRKTMELGLKIATKSLPSEITNHLLVFYLNKIRRNR